MGQPYTEAPTDTFDPVCNPTDWLEIIDGGASPSKTQLTNDSQDATLVGYIPWNKQRSAARWFLGFAGVDDNFVLHRDNPEAHPIWPWLYAAQIDFTPFNPVPNPENAEAPLQFVSPWYNPTGLVRLNIANHRLAVCTVRFRNFRYSFLDDSDITDPRLEWMRNVYLDLDPRVESLSVDGIGQLAFVETSARIAGPPVIPAGPSLAPTQTLFPAPLAQLLGKATYTLNWVNVPFEYLSAEDDYFYPANILACLGKVNSDEFPYNSSDPFLPGQLLCDGVKFTQKVFPVASADPSSPLVSVDVSMSLQYFNPPKGNASSAYCGHNLMPWRNNGLYYYATRVDPNAVPPAASVNTPPLLQAASFNNMFVSPNAG